jgi:hypothetical protein
MPRKVSKNRGEKQQEIMRGIVRNDAQQCTNQLKTVIRIAQIDFGLSRLLAKKAYFCTDKQSNCLW